MNVVLDIDETLIHTYSVSTERDPKADFSFKLERHYYNVKRRPGLKPFLEWLFENPKVLSVNIWTAGTRPYARSILKNILTERQWKNLHLFCSRKQVIGGKKPLSKIFNQQLTADNTIMIDDRVEVGEKNPGNLIVIPEFEGNKRDKCLFHLATLIDLILSEDIKTSPTDRPIYLKDMVS